ncbi:unnamed protein product [Tetraodon nigroviridis]|uniref:(spotted green pufferfish) hypothetical protein n=1 Tax=Tetraodon nigroviridis TaxID=99883 RepID=Q4REU0_TETNG|nr:unnamed protein product [Tetraodon nigroviridis]
MLAAQSSDGNLPPIDRLLLQLCSG